jgi:uncharacterized protein
VKIVIDTNVLISAGLFPHSVPFRALEFTVHVHRLIMSQDAVNELNQVINRPKLSRKLSATYRQEFIDFVVGNAEMIMPNTTIQACRDPKGNQFRSPLRDRPM